MAAEHWAALVVFGVAWLFYEPLLSQFAKRRGGVLNTDMTVIRSAWMVRMMGRETRLMDGQLLGHGAELRLVLRLLQPAPDRRGRRRPVRRREHLPLGVAAGGG